MAHEEQLDAARKRLADFEESGTHSDLIARLRAAEPMHPLLVGRALATGACVGGGVASVVSLIVPLLDRGIAQQMAALEAASGFAVPVALGLVTVCAGVVLIGTQFAAAAAGSDAPWRPREARIHQALVSELRQLEAQSAVRARLSPRGASPRIAPRS